MCLLLASVVLSQADHNDVQIRFIPIGPEFLQSIGGIDQRNMYTDLNKTSANQDFDVGVVSNLR